MIARIKAKYGRLIFVVISLSVVYSFSTEFAYVACASLVILLIVLRLFTENGRNAPQKIKVWNRLQEKYACSTAPNSQWCCGTGCVGELAYYFSAIANGSGIYIRNDEVGDSLVFFAWKEIAQIERSALQGHSDEYFIRVSFINDMPSVCVPWDLSFDDFVPSRVSYLMK